EHHGGDLFGTMTRCRRSRTNCLADVVVLTEDAAQVAVTEEDRPRSAPPPKTVLLAEVGKMARDDRVASCLTCGPLVFQPIYPAVPGTDSAIGQRRDGPLGAPMQLGASQREVGGAEREQHGARVERSNLLKDSRRPPLELLAD